MSAGKVLGSMLTAMVVLVLTTGSAAAQTSIGPNQQFAGVINGSAAKAVVRVVCPGPVGPNSTGPPVAGQGVQVVENTGTGFTGSAADRIVASFGSISGAAQILVFSEYGVPQNLPATFRLPCGGTRTIPFTPLPTSSTARSATVDVTFINIAV